jgi:hypothetical protein
MPHMLNYDCLERIIEFCDSDTLLKLQQVNALDIIELSTIQIKRNVDSYIDDILTHVKEHLTFDVSFYRDDSKTISKCNFDVVEFRRLVNHKKWRRFENEKYPHRIHLKLNCSNGSFGRRGLNESFDKIIKKKFNVTYDNNIFCFDNGIAIYLAVEG